MSPDTRACIAYAALRLISSRHASAVYDHARQLYVSINGAVTASALHLFDFSRNAHFGGTGANGQFNLYDFCLASEIELQILGKNYKGIDHATASHFCGTVDGLTTSLYDHASATRFDYTL